MQKKIVKCIIAPGVLIIHPLFAKYPSGRKLKDIIMKPPATRRRERLSIRLFRLNLMVYSVIPPFLALLYNGWRPASITWPYYAAIGWGLLLALQFVLVFAGKHKHRHNRKAGDR